MQNIRKQRIGENLIYVMVWLVIILVPILSSKMLGEEHVDLEAIFTSWRKIAPYLLLFIINNSLLAPKLLQKRRYVLYVLCDLAVITAIFGAVDLYEQFFPRVLPLDETVIANRKASFSDLALPWNILLGLFMTGANTMIKMLYQAMRNEQVMEALKHQNLQAEIDYLKYQINPHFFMNTLNKIHALIDIDADGAKDAVIELSKMMRYVLYDSGQRSISLEQDMQFMENYIQLMRIRYAEELDIRIDYPAREAAGISIPPLLLIVFVENAFKHGVSGSRASFIHIRVTLADKLVCCTIVNSKRPRSGAHAPGIGLKNVRKRLDLIYGGRYALDLTDAADTYTVQLTIPQLP